MRVVLDACVLVPTGLRHILIDLARDGLFDPVWSDVIFEEWRHAHARAFPELSNVGAEQAMLNHRFPHALHSLDQRDDLWLPDPNDIHVLNAAISAGAEVLLTANTKDFPIKALSRHGIARDHPDGFMLRFLDRSELDSAVSAALETAQTATGQSFSRRAFLKRIGLPRLAKAMG